MPSIRISSPSRIHFGLFSVGEQVQRQFGGIGLMIRSPRTEIEIGASDRLYVAGPSADDCKNSVKRWIDRLNDTDRSSLRSRYPEFPTSSSNWKSLPVQIQIHSLPPRHSGLGSGTQLALSTVTALNHFFQMQMPGPSELAISVDRGKRSAIGTYGFFQGGILVDRGKAKQETIAPLDFRTDFPEHWPVLIVLLKNATGLSGECEIAAFQKIPESAPQQYHQMVSLVRDSILPGLLDLDYDRFGNGVYEFGRQSGMLFKSVQGGPYQSPEVESMVGFIRDFGISAVGQTSWGPALFAIAPGRDQTDQLQQAIQQHFRDQFETILTTADNQGSTSQVINQEK